jgi:hypothetical protein
MTIHYQQELYHLLQLQILRLTQYIKLKKVLMKMILNSLNSLRQAHPNGTNQTDYAHASSRTPAPALPQIGGGLVYDLDVVLKVATERR